MKHFIIKMTRLLMVIEYIMCSKTKKFRPFINNIMDEKSDYVNIENKKKPYPTT